MSAAAVDLNPGFAAAAAVALAGCGAHLVLGSARVVRPLLTVEGLPRVSRWINYYTYHMATVTLLVMAAGFAWAAARPDAADAAVLLMTMAAIFAPLCAWVALRAGLPAWRLPPFWLFLIILAAGTGGFLLR